MFSALVRRLRLILSIVVVCLIVTAALAVPYVLHSAHAASPTHATNTCAQPPAGKDPTTFTSQQLKTYGLPPHLSGLSQARWANIVRHARHRFCFPATSPAPAVQHGLMRPLHAKGVVPDFPVTCCYAGVEGDASGFTEVSSAWVIPCTRGAPSSTTYTWIGLGSISTNGPYLRVGVVMYHDDITIQTPFGPIVESHPMYQTYFQDTNPTGDATTPTNFDVGCGDTIVGLILQDQPSQFLVILEDQNSGSYFLFDEGSNPDTTGASCLVGDDIHTPLHLFAFGTITFTGCEGTFNDGSGVVEEGLLAMPTHWHPDLSDCGEGIYINGDEYGVYNPATPAEISASTFTTLERSLPC